MSVLKMRRVQSKMEFINTAFLIYTKTVNFLSRLSARYSRLMAADTAHLAGEVMDNAEKANAVYPNSEERVKMRTQYLLAARGALMALDVRLQFCYCVMLENPEGAFTTASGKTVRGDDAARRLENMADELGGLIDSENELLKGAIRNTKKGRN